MTTTLPSPGVTDSSGDEWDSLPPAEKPVVDLAPAQALTEDKVAAGTCAGCGEPIVREPGARGRMPKYHPDCRPLKSASTSAATTTRRNGKAEAEADQCIVAFQQLITKTAVMLSVIDRYDAFCVMVALPQICDNLRGVLVRYDSLRKEWLAMKTGGSIIGLVLTVIMLVLPIAAHHGLLGRSNMAKVMVEMPFTLLKIQQQLKEGSEALTAMMAEQLKRAAEENRQARAAAEKAQDAS